MDNIRFILAIVLSVIILTIWQSYYSKKVPSGVSPEVSTIEQNAKEVESINIKPSTVKIDESVETHSLDDIYFVLSKKGGVIKEIGIDGEKIQLIADKKVFPLNTFLITKSKTISDIMDDYNIESNQNEIKLEGEKFDKIIKKDTDTLYLKIINKTADTGTLLVILNNDVKKLERIYRRDDEIKKLKRIKGNKLFKDLNWFALMEHYYITTYEPINGQILIRWENDLKTLEYKTNAKILKLRFNVLPKKYALLKSKNKGYEKAVFSGFIGYFSVLLLKLMNIFYKISGNYGISIILLSILLKIVLFPLSIKSLISTKKMQKIQPLLAELKEKYKDDQKAFGIEQMKLMKEHKVNPFGGCLPMFIQLPIWWGLFIMLRNAYELKDAVFILWLKDLSSPDPYRILPIFMGIFMYLQQKLTGMSMDKSQSSMMLMMPIMFTFISFSLPSGLVLYWLVTSIFGIIENRIFLKRIKV